MAKVKDETEVKQEEVYTLTNTAKLNGFSAIVDGVELSVVPELRGVMPNGKRGVVRPVDIYINNRSTGKDHFTDLTTSQVYQLVIANVIYLTKEQDLQMKKFIEKK